MEEFIEHLNEKTGKIYENILGKGENSYRDIIINKQFEYFLQHVNEIIGDDKLFKILQMNYPDKYTKGLNEYTSSAHRSIAKAMRGTEQSKPVKVITTNFDGFIEIAFDPKNAESCKVKVRDKDYEGVDNVIESANYFKLHGSTEEKYKEETVATLFVEGAGFSDKKRKFLERIFKSDQDKAVWFYGYGLNDYDMMLILKDLADDKDFKFTNLIFNLYKGEKDKNIELFEKIFAASENNESNVIGFTTDDSGYLLEEVLQQTHDSKNCIKYPFYVRILDEINITKEEATLLLSKFLGMVERGDSRGNLDVTGPLEMLLCEKHAKAYIESEIFHMIGQLSSDSDRQIKYLNLANRRAIEKCVPKSFHVNQHRYWFERMRLDTIIIESRRIGLYAKADNAIEFIEECNELIESADEMMKKYKNNKHNKYYRHFEILYYRCCNERARFMLLKGMIKDEQNEELSYLGYFCDENKIVGDLDVNAIAYYIKFLLNPITNFEYEKKSVFMYALLGNDMGKLVAAFIPL